MKSSNSVYIYLMALLLYMPFQAHSLETVKSFEIQEGTVKIAPVFCPFMMCSEVYESLSGTFNANITGNEITFSNINVSTTNLYSINGINLILSPLNRFELPDDPNEDSSGIYRRATFQFDGRELVVNGYINTREFHDFYQKYSFTALISEEPVFNADGYYTARLDLRMCASPMCGGIFVKSVNNELTRCADGTTQPECYIGTTNWDALGFNPFFAEEQTPTFAPILLKGSIRPGTNHDLGDFGEFVATEAYRPATDNQPEGTFSALISNGDNCTTSPCYAIDEYVLNSQRTREISDYDLNTVGASEEDIAIAESQFSENSPIIVVGHNIGPAELYSDGVTFFANQLYLPIIPATQQ